MTAVAEQILIWLVGKLRPYGRNPRINDHAVDKMIESIREFGFKIPVLARSSGEIVDGHLRWKAAIKMGLKEVPVILCDDWDEAKVRRFRLLVNRSTEWASWDMTLLYQELKGMTDIAGTGFDEFELQQMEIDAYAEVDGVSVPVSDNRNARLMADREMIAFAAIYMKDISVFESALIATGSRNRGEAVAIICQAYLDSKKTTQPAS